jgi:hypothetical protein
MLADLQNDDRGRTGQHPGWDAYFAANRRCDAAHEALRDALAARETAWRILLDAGEVHDDGR